MRSLSFDSPEECYQSWVKAFDNDPDFKAAVLTGDPIIPTKDGIGGLRGLIAGDKEEVERCIYMCVGYAIING